MSITDAEHALQLTDLYATVLHKRQRLGVKLLDPFLESAVKDSLPLFADATSFKVSKFLYDSWRLHFAARHIRRDDMRHDHAAAKWLLRVHYSFSHFVHLGQTVAGVFCCPFSAMHAAGAASTFT